MKRFSFTFIILLLVAVFLSSPAFAQGTVSTVSVTSSTQGTEVVARKGNGGVIVTVPSDAAVAVYFARFTGDCADMTTRAGVRITAGNGFEFLPLEDRYGGAICAILESGSVPVTVEVNQW